MTLPSWRQNSPASRSRTSARSTISSDRCELKPAARCRGSTQTAVVSNARALFLYEAPGARSTGALGPRSGAAGSGIISPDNNDTTAENSWLLYREARVPRRQAVYWNIVPWYIGTTSKIRRPNADDLALAQPYLGQLLRLLPQLRVVVAFGDKARDGWLRFLLLPDAPLVPTLACPHPSPQVLRVRPEYRGHILAALRRVATIVD